MSSVWAMSFNVRQDTATDGADAWPNRREFVASTVRLHRPDVVGLQEPLAHQFEYLRETLPGYGWVGVGRLGGDEGEFSPVGYRRDRFDCLDSETFWLSETPAEAGSVGWDASHARVVTWVRLRDRERGAEFHHYNTHFDHTGASARRESAGLLCERLPDGDVVVTGDLNCEPGSPPYRLLVGGEDAPLRDAKAVARHGHHGPEGTFHEFTGEPGPRIDYVLVSPSIEVRQHATLADRRDGRYPADHFPVLAELQFLKG